VQFKDGANVYTADGERVGTIERAVIEPGTKEVTHLVVEKGFLFTEDKVVPMSLVGPATENKVTLRDNAGDLEELPDFIESYYVSTDTVDQRPQQQAPGIGSIYWYPPIGSRPATGLFDTNTRSQYVRETLKNIPEGSVALEEGAKVISSDDKPVGKIEQIFTDSPEDRVTHILISQGLIVKEKKLVPVNWIGSMSESEIKLVVSSRFIDTLPDYQPSL